MTVEELANRMTPQELTFWYAYYEIKNQEARAAANKAKHR